MKKVALIVYHKNLYSIYKPEWIEQFKYSILNQTYKDFEIYETNYGAGEERIFENSNYDSFLLPSFIHAMNYLLWKTMRDGYDCVGNVNCDDWYSLQRLEKQLPFIEQGYDIVSSNFSLIEDDKIVKTHSFEKVNLAIELSNNHNCLCHPVIMYHKRFIENNKYVPEQFPLEDMMLWQRTIKNYKFIILPDVLCFHRLHDQSVCQSENR